MKTAKQYIEEETTMSTWIHEDEVEQLCKAYAREVAEAVRSACANSKIQEISELDVTKFIK